MGLGCGRFLTKVGNHRCRAACGVADSCGNVMNRSGILEECHCGNHRVFRQILYEGCILFACQLEGCPGAIPNIDCCRFAVIAASQGDGLNLVLWIGGDRNRKVVLTPGETRDLAMVGAADHQRTVGVGTVAGILGSVSAARLIGGAAGCQIAVRCTLGANGCGGNGIQLLNRLTVDRHVTAYLNGAIGSCGFDQRLCRAIDHCNRNAACNTHMAGARAGNGMGDKGVGRRGLRGFGLQLQPRGYGIQRSGRQSLAYSLQGVNGIFLHGFCHIALEEILHCGHVNNIGEYLVGNIGGHHTQLRAGRQGVRVGIVFHRFAGKHRLNLGQHHVQYGVDYLRLDCFCGSRTEVGKPVFNSLLNIGGNQALQAGAAEKGIHSVANQLGNRTVFAEEAFVESVPQTAQGSLQIQFFGQLVKEFGKGLAKKLFNDGIVLGVLLGNNLLYQFLVHQCSHFQIAGGDGSIANNRQIIIGNHIDGYGNAHANPGVGCAGICVDRGNGVVFSVHRDLAGIGGLDSHTVFDGSLGCVLMHIQNECCRNLDAALGGLCHLTAGHHGVQRFLRKVAGTGGASHSDTITNGAVGLFVCFGFLFRCSRISLPLRG